eukprot:PITA_10464
MRAHPTPLFPIVTVGPFTKWGIDFTTCHLPSAANHKYIILAIDYFMKWAEAMPTYKNDIECEIPSPKLAIELLLETSCLEERLLHLEHLDEQRRDAAIVNEAHKKRVKTQYDKAICPHVFFEGDLVLVYDQDKDTLEAGKFKPMWYGPFIIKRFLTKGSYELINFEGNKLAEP